MAEPEVLWTPSPERIERATLTRYARWLEETRGVRFDGYSDLWRWSVDDIEGFWTSIVSFLEVRFSVPGERVLSSLEMPGTEWFPGSRLSYAEHIFRGKDDSATALLHASELRPAGGVDVGRLAARDRGDRRRPAQARRRPRATASRRTCRTSRRPSRRSWRARRSARSGPRRAPEFGSRSVIDRFAQIEPKVLLAVDGYRYGGKDFDRRRGGRRGSRPSSRHSSTSSRSATSTDRRLGGRVSRRASRSRSRSCRSTIRCGCSTAPARPGCRSRSSTARAGSCSST